MPMLDVSFVMDDPMLSELFDVQRRPASVGADGRVVVAPVWFRKQRGVVTQQDPADLSRRDDGQVVPRVIEVSSRFIFREATRGFQPDYIVWQGTAYLVTRVYPWSTFGKGYSRCVADSTNAADPPQP